MPKTRSAPSVVFLIAILFLSLQLSACGGGGGDSGTFGTGGGNAAPNAEGDSGTPSAGGGGGPAASPGTDNSSNPATPAPLAIVSDSDRVMPGGAAITLHLVGVPPDAVVQWTLDSQDPGRLDRTSGNTVTYIPPAADSGITEDTAILINAAAGQVSAMTQITLVGETTEANNAPPAANPAPQVPADSTVPDVAGIFGVIAQNERTPAGGTPIRLSASKPSATGNVSWRLENGSVGSLSSTSGDSVEYIPPPAGSLADNVAVVISASIGNVTKKTTVFVEGTNGLQLLAGNDYGMGSVNASGTAARFAPQYITRDAQGNLYAVAGSTIRKITPEGSVTILAGSAASSGLADGTGTLADFITPRGIAADAAGNLYVVNTYVTGTLRYTYSVRRITPEGVVTTFADKTIQKGEWRHSNILGLAIDAEGNAYVADTRVYRDITKITPDGTVTTFASGQWDAPSETRLLNVPRDMVFDSAGNLYVLDAGTDRYLTCGPTCNYWAAAIRKITPQGAVTTFAGPEGPIMVPGPNTGPARDGTGTDARFTPSLNGLTIDPEGNLYVSDGATIRKITPDAVVTTLPTMVTPDPSRIWLASDPAGKLFVSSMFGGVRETAANGDLITLAGGTAPMEGERNGRGMAALFDGPMGVASDAAGNLYVADEFNHAVRKITPAGDVTTLYKTPAEAVEMNSSRVSADGHWNLKRTHGMRNITVDDNGNVFVDSFAGIRKITPAGIASIVAQSERNLVSVKNHALATDAAGNLYDIAQFSSTIRKTTPEGVSTTITPINAEETPLDAQDLTLDKAGNFYILSHTGVLKMTPEGVVSVLAAAPTGRLPTIPATLSLQPTSRFAPKSIAIDQDDNIYAAYAKGADALIQRIAPQGATSIVYSYSADEISTGKHFMPKGIAMADAGTIAVTSANGVFRLKFR